MLNHKNTSLLLSFLSCLFLFSFTFISFPKAESEVLISQPYITLDPSSTPAECQRSIGDANCDGLVNLADFEIWRQDFTAERRQIEPRSDFNGDTNADLSDFEIWRGTYTGGSNNPTPTCDPRQVGGCGVQGTPPVNPTCSPRPACLDATPACYMPEPEGGFCPPVARD